MKYAVSKTASHNPADIVVYTDADTAVDLRQMGLIMEPIVNVDEDNKTVTFNNTVSVPSRHPRDKGFAMPGLDPSPKAEENVINGASKAVTGKFLTPSLKLRDTQCGFKAYPRQVLENSVLPKTKDVTFTFETEQFFYAKQEGDAELKAVPVYWSDSSPEASGTNARARWEMFKTFIDQIRNVLEDETIDEEDLKIIESAVDEASALAKGERHKRCC
jgi:hypothetical protein